MSTRTAVPRRLLSWLLTLAWAGFIFFLSAQPSANLEQLGLRGELLSTAAHFFAYAILAGLLLWALERSSSLPSPRLQVITLILVGLYAMSDEYHQSFVPGRTATALDWLIDMVGAAVAVALLTRIQNRRNCREAEDLSKEPPRGAV